MSYFGYGERNNSGVTVIKFLEENLFQELTPKKWFWINSNGKTKNEIDYILSTDNTLYKTLQYSIDLIQEVTTGSLELK